MSALSPMEAPATAARTWARSATVGVRVSGHRTRTGAARVAGGLLGTLEILLTISHPLLGSTSRFSRTRCGGAVGGRGERGGGDCSSRTATGDIVVPQCRTVNDDKKVVRGSSRHGGGHRQCGTTMLFELKWKCSTQGSTRSARLHLRCQLALKGHTLLMQFMRPMTLTRRVLLWLEDVQVGKVGKPSGAAAADTARCWGPEVGVLDNVRVTVSIWWRIGVGRSSWRTVGGMAESSGAALMGLSRVGGAEHHGWDDGGSKHGAE